MGGALEMHIRCLIIEQLTKSQCSMIAVCKEYGWSHSAVRRLWKRYKAEGSSGLKPHYDQCGCRKPIGDTLIYRGALWLKRHHPAYGI